MGDGRSPSSDFCWPRRLSFSAAHPSNICNLMPFMVLVLLRALDRPGNVAQSRPGQLIGFGLAVSVAALALSPWVAISLQSRPDTRYVVLSLRITGRANPEIEAILTTPFLRRAAPGRGIRSSGHPGRVGAGFKRNRVHRRLRSGRRSIPLLPGISSPVRGGRSTSSAQRAGSGGRAGRYLIRSISAGSTNSPSPTPSSAGARSPSIFRAVARRCSRSPASIRSRNSFRILPARAAALEVSQGRAVFSRLTARS